MFIVVPVGMNYRTERMPIVTFTLMGLNVLVYLVSLAFFFANGEDAELWIYENLWLIPADSAWHTYLTSMFVHAGFFHLLGNMMYLFLFGTCVEDMLGRWRFAVMYLAGGIVADLVYIAAIPDHFSSTIPMGGASGAISACLGAYLLLRASVDIDFKYFGLIFLRPFAGEFSLAAWIVITFWFVKDLFFMFLSFHFSKGDGGVAFGAHVGGFLAGLGAIGLCKAFEKGTGNQPVAAGRAAPSAIPVSAEDMAATLFLYESNAQSGPFSLVQVRQMLALGSITPEAFYWQEGMQEWRSVSELAG